MLKGPDNLKEYDRICKAICTDNGWNWERIQSSVLANAKYIGSDQNIRDIVTMETDDDEEDNPFLQPKTLPCKPNRNSLVKHESTTDVKAEQKQSLLKAEKHNPVKSETEKPCEPCEFAKPLQVPARKTLPTSRSTKRNKFSSGGIAEMMSNMLGMEVKT